MVSIREFVRTGGRREWKTSGSYVSTQKVLLHYSSPFSMSLKMYQFVLPSSKYIMLERLFSVGPALLY